MNRAMGRVSRQISRVLPLLLAGLLFAQAADAKPKMVSGKKAKWVDEVGVIVGEVQVDNETDALAAAKAEGLINALQQLGTYKNLDQFRAYYIAKFNGVAPEVQLGTLATEYLELVEQNHTLAYTEVQGWKDGKKSWFVGLSGYTVVDTSQTWLKEFAEKYIAKGEALAAEGKKATAAGNWFAGIEKCAQAYSVFEGLVGALGDANPDFPQIVDLFSDAEMRLEMKLKKLNVWPIVKRKYIAVDALPKALKVTLTYDTPEGTMPLVGVPMRFKAAEGLTVSTPDGELVTNDMGQALLSLDAMTVTGPVGIRVCPIFTDVASNLGGMYPVSKFEVIDASTGITFSQDMAPMVMVEADSFLMGAADGDNLSQDDETPSVMVKVGSFYIDTHEVTNGQYVKFLEDTGYRGESRFAYVEELSGADKPVVGISYKDALAYALWAGKTLPTEAQWELAARGKEVFIFPWGMEFDASQCANLQNSSTTANAGSFGGASPYGAVDMAGNVWEWTRDYYDWELLSKQTAGKMYQRPEKSDLVSVRGGSYKSGPADLRSSNRLGMNPAARTDDIGFRCVREVN